MTFILGSRCAPRAVPGLVRSGLFKASAVMLRPFSTPLRMPPIQRRCSIAVYVRDQSRQDGAPSSCRNETKPYCEASGIVHSRETALKNSTVCLTF